MTGDLPIGRRVANLRARRGMSQQLMADLLGKSKSWLDKIERGERRLDRLSVIYAIANLLQIDVRLLLFEHPEPVSAAASHTRAVVTSRRLWDTAHREVDQLIRQHLGLAATLHRKELVPMWQVLTWVYAAMAVEGVEPSRRQRVVATICQLHRRQRDHPSPVDAEKQPRLE